MALKTFSSEYYDVFNTEQSALRDLDKLHPDHKLVKYLGCYQHGELSELTYNILLEFGQLDLDEYFACTAPPTTFDGVVAFWRKLFRIVDALKIVHDPSTEKGRRFKGYGYYP